MLLVLHIRRTVRYLFFVWDKLVRRKRNLDATQRIEFYLSMWKDASAVLHAEFSELDGGYSSVLLNGRTTTMYQNLVMIDHPVTVKIARDKPMALRTLKSNGISVPRHCAFSLQQLRLGDEFLKEIGAACVVKPAHNSAGGDGVTTNVRSRRDLHRAAIYASLYSHLILIEEQIAGDSYRLLYLDGEMLDAIRRKSPTIVGDGHSTIKELVAQENARRARLNGETALTELSLDLDCINTLREAGLAPGSVSPQGMEVKLKLATNDNADHENESIPDLVCDSIVAEGALAARVLGVRLAGVDVITPKISVPLRESGGVINEVNATPGLHYHYQVVNRERRIPVAVPLLRHLLGITNGTSQQYKTT